MKDNWFENKMNERFDEFDSDLDLHAAWEELEQLRQPKKKKRRGLVFWWFGTGTAVVLLSLGFLLNSYLTSEISNKKAIPRLEASHKINDNTTTLPTDNQQVKSIKQNSSFLKNDILIEENLIEKKIPEKLNNYSKKSETNLLFTNSEFHHNSTQRSKNSLSNDRLAHKSQIRATEQSRKSFSPISITPHLVKSIAYLPQNELELLIPETNIKKDSEDELPPNKYKLNTVGITLNYGKAFRTAPVGRGINSAYFQRRDLAETPLDAWSTQLFYQRRNKKQWFLQANLAYFQTTNLFEDNYSVSRLKMLENQVVQVNRYPNGSSEEITADVLATEEETTNASFYQRYRHAFIGLDIGKEKDLGSDFNLRLALGAEYSLFRKDTGKIYADENSLDSYLELSDATDDTGNIFAVKLSLEIGKKFKDNNEINLGIIGKSNLNIMQNDLGKRFYLLSSLSYRKHF